MNWVMYTNLRRFLRQVMDHHLASKRHKGGAQRPTSLDALRSTALVHFPSPVMRWHVDADLPPLPYRPTFGAERAGTLLKVLRSHDLLNGMQAVVELKRFVLAQHLTVSQ